MTTETEQRLNAIAKHYIQLKRGIVNPTGTVNNGLWIPTHSEIEECCRKITFPTPRYPYTLLEHCRTIKHLATKYRCDEKNLRSAIKKALIEERNNRKWHEPLICPKCKKATYPVREERLTLRDFYNTLNGMSDEIKAIITQIDFNGNDYDKPKTLFRYAHVWQCVRCTDTPRKATFCNNEAYFYNKNKEKWIKLRGYKTKTPTPLKEKIVCSMCQHYLTYITPQKPTTNHGLEDYTQQQIDNSTRLICLHCKEHNNPNGFIYRRFDDKTIKRYNQEIAQYVNTTHRRQPTTNRQTDRQNNATYTTTQTNQDRLIMLIKTKKDTYKPDKNGIIKNLTPFKTILDETHETEIATELENLT